LHVRSTTIFEARANDSSWPRPALPQFDDDHIVTGRCPPHTGRSRRDRPETNRQPTVSRGALDRQPDPKRTREDSRSGRRTGQYRGWLPTTSASAERRERRWRQCQVQASPAAGRTIDQSPGIQRREESRLPRGAQSQKPVDMTRAQPSIGARTKIGPSFRNYRPTTLRSSEGMNQDTFLRFMFRVSSSCMYLSMLSLSRIHFGAGKTIRPYGKVQRPRWLHLGPYRPSSDTPNSAMTAV